MDEREEFDNYLADLLSDNSAENTIDRERLFLNAESNNKRTRSVDESSKRSNDRFIMEKRAPTRSLHDRRMMSYVTCVKTRPEKDIVIKENKGDNNENDGDKKD